MPVKLCANCEEVLRLYREEEAEKSAERRKKIGAYYEKKMNKSIEEDKKED